MPRKLVELTHPDDPTDIKYPHIVARLADQLYARRWLDDETIYLWLDLQRQLDDQKGAYSEEELPPILNRYLQAIKAAVPKTRMRVGGKKLHSYDRYRPRSRKEASEWSGPVSKTDHLIKLVLGNLTKLEDRVGYSYKRRQEAVAHLADVLGLSEESIRTYWRKSGSENKHARGRPKKSENK